MTHTLHQIVTVENAATTYGENQARFDCAYAPGRNRDLWSGEWVDEPNVSIVPHLIYLAILETVDQDSDMVERFCEVSQRAYDEYVENDSYDDME